MSLEHVTFTRSFGLARFPRSLGWLACLMWIAPVLADGTDVREAEQGLAVRGGAILAKHCIECHDSESEAGDLDLTRRAGALRGGESGPALIPDDLESSPLWREVVKGKMPPSSHPRLTEEEVSDYRRWVLAGAPWPVEVIDPSASAAPKAIQSGPSPATATANPVFYANKFKLLEWIDDSGASHPITHPTDWPRRRAAILRGMEQVMGSLPARDPQAELEIEVLESETLERVVRKKIRYLAGPGDRVPAYLLIPRQLDGPAPAILCLHGTSGSRGRTAGVGADYPRYTLELAERGYVTIAPDYTLLGDNQTDPQSLGYTSGTMKGIWCHLRAVDLLESLPEVDPERIGCCGLSLGGHNALFLAAFDPRMKVVVTSSGFDSFQDYMDGDLTGWCQPRYMPAIRDVFDKDADRLPFDFPEVLAAIAPRSVYVHAPRDDSNFKVESVRRCVAAAAAVYRLLDAESELVAEYPPGPHGFPPDARERAYRFIDRVLKGT